MRGVTDANFATAVNFLGGGDTTGGTPLRSGVRRKAIIPFAPSTRFLAVLRAGIFTHLKQNRYLRNFFDRRRFFISANTRSTDRRRLTLIDARW